MHPEEFKTLVLSLHRSLYRFARSFLADSQEAEDCVQEVFLKLWLKRSSLADVNNLKAFAMQMTRNLSLDKLKSRKHVTLDIAHERITSDLSPHQQLEAADAVACMEKVIALLPEQQRTLIHLRNVEGLEMKEIAEVTDMTVEHVRVTLSRARTAVRQLYQQHYGSH